MKQIHKSLYFIAAITAISFVSCQKQELESSTNGTRITINATVEPAMNTTKTHVVPEEGDIYNIEWDSNEHMRVIVYNSSTCNKLETTNFTLNDNGTGTFEAEIPSGEWTNISGIYPLSATDGTRSEDKQTDYRISLPQVQIPSRDSYDPKAFIMIARNTEVPEDLNNYVWNAYYYRATALNNFTIKNLEHADNIVNVKITFPEDELVAGYKRVDLTTCTVTGNRYQNSPNYIELKYTEPLSADASGNYELWFTTWEINVEPDETVKVEITTEDYKYTKDFTGHSASFKESFLNLLTLDMSNATVEKLETDDLSGEYLIAAYKDGSWAIMTPENKSGYYVAEVASSISTPIADISCEDFYPIPNVQDYVWTVTAMENGYSICNNESYISINDKDANAKSSATELSIVRNNDGTYLIEEPNSTFNRALLYNSNANPTRFKPYLKSEIETYPAPVLIPWVESTEPALIVSEASKTVAAEATEVVFEYIARNLTGDVTATIASDESQIISGQPVVNAGASTVTVTLNPNTDEVEKTATITLSADGVEPITLTVIQKAFVPESTTIKATVAEFLAAEVNDNVWYELTGTITDLYNTEYGNFHLVDETGTVRVYGLTAEKVSSNDKSFSSLGLKEGDIVTLIGTRTEYNNEAQVGGPAYYVSHVVAPYCNVSPSKLNVPAEAGTTTFNISSNEYWMIESNNPAYTVSPEEGTGNATITITYPANESEEPVEVSFTVLSDSGIENTVTLTQRSATSEESALATLVTSESEIVPGKYIILGEFSEGVYALPNKESSSSAPVEVAIESTQIVEGNGVLTAIDDNYVWQFTSSGNGFTINPSGDSSIGLGCTNDNNGLRNSSSYADVVWTFATTSAKSGWEISSLDTQNNQRWICGYKPTNWRTYKAATTNANCTFRIYKLSE